MKLLEWIGRHPVLSIILLILVGSVLEDIIKAFLKGN